MKIVFENLQREAITISGLKMDSRWKRWVKFVDRVDLSRSDGYCFIGEFVSDGTVEVELSKPRLLLVHTTTGSNKYRIGHYQVCWLNPDRTLVPIEGLSTTNKTSGWALRLRDKIAAILKQPAFNPLAEFSTEELKAELSRREELQ